MVWPLMLDTKGDKEMKYEILSNGQSWGKFNSQEEAYEFAVNHIKRMKLMCGDIYIPYIIIEVK